MTQIRPLAQPVRRRPGELGVHSLDRFQLRGAAHRGGAEILCVLRPRRARGARRAAAAYPRPSASLGRGDGRAAQAAAVHLVRGLRGGSAALSRAARPDAHRAARPAAGRAIERPLQFRDPDGTPIRRSAWRRRSSPNEKSSFDNAKPGPSCCRCAEPQPGGGGAVAAAARPYAGVHPRHSGRDQVLRRGAGAAAVGPLGRRHRVHARHPRQRSSHDRLRQIGRARAASFELGRLIDQRDRHRRHADGRPRRGHGRLPGWGSGRHVLGSNYFHYVRDPWGSYAEFSFDIDYIPVDHDWQSGDHPPEDSFYVWGPGTAAGGFRVQLRSGKADARGVAGWRRGLRSNYAAGHGASLPLRRCRRGWGEGATMNPYRTARAPIVHLLPHGGEGVLRPMRSRAPGIQGREICAVTGNLPDGARDARGHLGGHGPGPARWPG